MIAAIYARYSSDSQRDESIEIQVDKCKDYIDAHDWVTGEVYADFAMTGRNGDRPSFKRCIEDGANGLFDVLVIYKLDRLARNVMVSKEATSKLREAGVEIVSVREGTLEDTPDGYLMETMGEMMAEYYSRNLSVLIRNGNRKNAEKLKASGRRLLGYTTDENDHYVIDESTADIVRSAFTWYLAGQSTPQIAKRLNDDGRRTLQGRPFSHGYISKLLKRRDYIGEYSYAGHTVVGGMPAIISEEDFAAAQNEMEHRKIQRRKKNETIYILSDKLWCLRCGKPMCGTSGTGKSGKKYTYYGCCSKAGNCGLRISADKLEQAVMDGVVAILESDGSVEDMVQSVLEYADSLPDRTDEYLSERTETCKRRDRYVASIAEGVPGSAVAEAIRSCEKRIAELDYLITREDFNKSRRIREDDAREFMNRFIKSGAEDYYHAEIILNSFVDRIYTDGKTIVVLFSLSDEEPVTYEEILELIQNEHPQNSCSEGVRASVQWWSVVTSTRTLYRLRETFAIVIQLE